ncbi:DEAD/DEAH box helicase family protein [Actinospongicola halichondriae]|uniref:DEAD/DEAH box helicase family protein n=1 Tax=Actinospongicola halichondriae TaxID=3236844 RepID=UPI003D3ED772
MTTGLWRSLEPTFDWRPSQRHLLDLATRVADERWHLCAPPGAGKTLIGLELARRLDRPTLVLSPTSAIREQWRESIRLFGGDPETFTTDDPDVDAPLLSITYQLIGNPGQATAELHDAARRLWCSELEADFGVDGAEARVAAVEAADPRRAAKDLRRHVRVLRRALATGDDLGIPVEQLLGPAAHDVVDRLAVRGIGCVVLDECHHLLDWWALVVAALVERIDPAVVGLTATLPEPDGAREAENYTRVLGPVDAELHLAALVAEGSVAPWRDAVRLTPVTPGEQQFLDGWVGAFTDALDAITARETFVTWAVESLGSAALDHRAELVNRGPVDDGDEGAARWDEFWDRDPIVAVAMARWWRGRGLSLPADFSPPDGADVTAELRLDDRLALLDAWIHDETSTASTDDREAVASVTRRHGVSITTAGVRWGRSVADVVCARSAAKADAAASVVALELESRGAPARALVVVERDRAGTPPAEAREVLGDDAGTAATMLGRLCGEATVVHAGVMAVTGSGAWCDAVHAAEVAVVASGDGASVSIDGCDTPGAVALTVDGASWSPADWLDAAERALDAGIIQVLVATRGLVGEGWDHPALDVLVDCSEVASRTAATQLRGRALRIDPAKPDKVASLWDVAVAHPTSHGDWRRVRRRHEHWWGPDADGVLRTGPEKLHPVMGSSQPPDLDSIAAINAVNRSSALDRDATRDAWGSIDAGGVATAAVAVRRRRAPRRVRTRTRRWRHWIAGASSGAGLSAASAVASVAVTPFLWPLALGAAAASGAMAMRARGGMRADQETLVALGEAVAAGLREVGVPGLDGAVVDAEGSDEGVTVVVNEVDDDAAAAWSAAMTEVLGPLGTPRWLVAAGDEAWRVPGVVGATRVAAEAFASALAERVPDAVLCRAGDPEATVHVLRAASRRPDEVVPSLRWR